MADSKEMPPSGQDKIREDRGTARFVAAARGRGCRHGTARSVIFMYERYSSSSSDHDRHSGLRLDTSALGQVCGNPRQISDRYVRNVKRRGASTSQRRGARGYSRRMPCVSLKAALIPKRWGRQRRTAAVTAAVFLLLDLARPLWQASSTTALIILAAALIGALLGRWCVPLKRLILGRARMEESVLKQAKAAFFDGEISRTQERLGVLIFVSLLEREAVVLADSGIKVSDEAWRGVVQRLTSGAARGLLADGLVDAVDAAAKVLMEAGLSGDSGPDELGNAPVTGGSH